MSMPSSNDHEASLPAFRSVPGGPGKVLDCTGAIVRLISSGEIDPRRRIGEASLARRLAVSRTAIRSALEHLEAGGLVERRPRAGTYLRQISAAEFSDAMDVRAALEALAAGEAAIRIRKTDLRKLSWLAEEVDRLGLRRLEGEAGVAAELIDQDLIFHLTLARLSGNSRLAGTLQQLRLIEFTLIPGAGPNGAPRHRSVPTHREIVDAVASKDSRRASRVVRLHILRTKEARVGRTAGS
jgi:DNA-binding GntR family transcriptional regulator